MQDKKQVNILILINDIYLNSIKRKLHTFHYLFLYFFYLSIAIQNQFFLNKINRHTLATEPLVYLSQGYLQTIV